MPSANLGAVGRRACVATALVLSISSAPAHAIVVDGDLSDLIGAVNLATYNDATALDALGSTESTESNNGFDIRNVYAFYEKPSNVLYLGMNFYGTVGDSRAVTDTTSTNEYSATCASTYCNRSVFDTNETYSIRLFDGTRREQWGRYPYHRQQPFFAHHYPRDQRSQQRSRVQYLRVGSTAVTVWLCQSGQSADPFQRRLRRYKPCFQRGRGLQPSANASCSGSGGGMAVRKRLGGFDRRRAQPRENGITKTRRHHDNEQHH
ncbi:MAG: hypothetical protein HZB57_10425 [Gammaproteobacteria bacterium]|nr:hypothetical protein [Gammaproteobacteria bacterium]